MAKVKINGIKSVFNAVTKVFDETVSRELLTEIGAEARDRVVKQTRAGRQMPLAKDGERGAQMGKQPALSPGYIRYRERLKDDPEFRRQEGITLPSKFFADESYLTLTGQMLKSVVYRIAYGGSDRDGRSRSIVIKTTGARNDIISADLEDREPSRRFIGYDFKGYERIRSKVVRLLRRNIANFNK